jgi:prophage regulatory protein
VSHQLSRKPAKPSIAPVAVDQVSILRLPQVISRVGRCRSGLYADIAAGRFPRPIKLSERAVGWLDDEVSKWLLDRVAARDGGKRK